MGLLGGFKGKLKGKEKPPKPEAADVVCVKYNKVFSEFDSPASSQPSTSSTNNHPKVRRTDGATPHNRLSRMPTTIMRPEMKTMFEKLQNELAEKSTPPPPRPPTPTASTPQNGAIPKTKSSTANNKTEPKAVPKASQKPTEVKKLDSKKVDNKKEKTAEKKKDAPKNKKEATPQKPDDKADKSLKNKKETAAKLEAQKKAELKLKKNEKSKEKSSKHLTPTKNKMAAPKSPMIDRTINKDGGSVETSFKTVNKAQPTPSSSAAANELLPPPLPQQPPPYSEVAMTRTKENWSLAAYDTAEDDDGNFQIQIATTTTSTRKTNDDDGLYATANYVLDDTNADDDGGNFKIHFADHGASSGAKTSFHHVSDEEDGHSGSEDDEEFLHESDLSPINYSSHAANIFFGGTDEEPVVVRPRNIAMTKSSGDGDDESYGSSASA